MGFSKVSVIQRQQLIQAVIHCRVWAQIPLSIQIISWAAASYWKIWSMGILHSVFVSADLSLSGEADMGWFRTWGMRQSLSFQISPGCFWWVVRSSIISLHFIVVNQQEFTKISGTILVLKMDEHRAQFKALVIWLISTFISHSKMKENNPRMIWEFRHWVINMW